MTPVDSLIKDHNPAEGRYGDCFRACIASLLDLPAEEVPHFCDGLSDDDTEGAYSAIDTASRFCFERTECKYFELPVMAESLDEFLSGFGPRLEGIHYILLGASARANHVVVACGSDIVHDPTYGQPHGIIRPARSDDAQSFFWVGLLVRNSA